MNNNSKLKNKFDIISFILLCIPCLAMAQRSMPSDISPFNGSIVIKYNPLYKSLCSVKSMEKKKGDFFGTSRQYNLTSEVFRTSEGELKISLNTSGVFAEGAGSNDYLKLIYSIREGGLTDGDEPIFQTNLNLTPEEKSVIKNTLTKVGVPGGWLVNKQLQNGMILQTPDLCSIMGKSFNLNFTNAKFEGGNRVVGVGMVSGKESIIFATDESVVCSIANSNIQFKNKGWFAIDRRSGLRTGNSMLSTITTNEGVLTAEENHDCEVTGALAESTTSSAENRLKELKSLLEKNFISKEIYDQKNIEILKNL